jgi:hypothetical protein
MAHRLRLWQHSQLRFWPPTELTNARRIVAEVEAILDSSCQRTADSAHG